MYQLSVFYPGDEGARSRLTVPQSASVEALVQKLLAKHADCERVEVNHNSTRLFSVRPADAAYA